ncbi:porin family protein [Dyadobacter sp. CY261]|uniref:porin family protein n=1 Tax=Dyadobacter sp. CY261 TaxID=2907203 RepID=UPI001F27AAEB|nr:porin family protein [Dyadobacter sp. CY261]MCF0075181.1 porin family protein [Dyadobacter sp. CY261]
MKKLSLSVFVLFCSARLWAQQNVQKPDLIFTRNKSVLEARIDSVGAESVYYHSFSRAEKVPLKLLLTEIVSVRFADGREQRFDKQPAHTVERISAGVKKEKSANLQEEPKRVKSVDKGHRPAITMTIGAEGMHMLGNDNWVKDDEKAAFGNGVGATAALDLHLTGHFALSVSGGYNQWRVSRNYVEDGQTRFSAKTSFIEIPLHLGLKLYPFKGLYLMPEGGYHIYTFEYQDGTELSENITGGSLAYGGRVGYELRTGVFLMDISAKYNLVNIGDLGNGFAGMGPARYAGVRLGVGFIKRKK